MKKLIVRDQQARQKLMEGIDTLADLVACTLSPKGRNVAFVDEFGTPRVVHDGVSVAKQVFLDDEFQDLGATLVKEAAVKTNDVAGDGTTTATIIAREIVKEGFSAIEGDGANPMDVKKGIEMGTKIILEAIEKEKRAIGDEDIESIAIISAQSEEIGKLVAQAVQKVGKDGLVAVEESSSGKTEIEYQQGFQFNKGWASPWFITDLDREEAVMEEAHVLLVDHRLQTTNQLVPLLEKFIKDRQNLVIIAEKIESDALKFLVHNHRKGHLKVICIKAPERGDRKKSVLHDLAVMTGATVISEDAGMTVAGATLNHLGRAKKVIVNGTKTIIIGGYGEEADKEEHVAKLRASIEEERDEYQKQFFQERLARLTGGAAVIYAGAPSDIEMRDSKERIIDAVYATQAAIEEGILPGGGGVLLRASMTLAKSLADNPDLKSSGVELGMAVVAAACWMPFIKLMENAGIDAAGKKEVAENPGFGIDVMDGQIKDMIEAKIIDPFKVVRLALTNAASVGATIITTYGMIVPKAQKE